MPQSSHVGENAAFLLIFSPKLKTSGLHELTFLSRAPTSHTLVANLSKTFRLHESVTYDSKESFLFYVAVNLLCKSASLELVINKNIQNHLINDRVNIVMD